MSPAKGVARGPSSDHLVACTHSRNTMRVPLRISPRFTLNARSTTLQRPRSSCSISNPACPVGEKTGRQFRESNEHLAQFTNGNVNLADYVRILQADAYAELNNPYAPTRRPGPLTEVACLAR